MANFSPNTFRYVKIETNDGQTGVLPGYLLPSFHHSIHHSINWFSIAVEFEIWAKLRSWYQCCQSSQWSNSTTVNSEQMKRTLAKLVVLRVKNKRKRDRLQLQNQKKNQHADGEDETWADDTITTKANPVDQCEWSNQGSESALHQHETRTGNPL
jgi:hypothetical protein